MLRQPSVGLSEMLNTISGIDVDELETLRTNWWKAALSIICWKSEAQELAVMVDLCDFFER